MIHGATLLLVFTSTLNHLSSFVFDSKRRYRPVKKSCMKEFNCRLPFTDSKIFSVDDDMGYYQNNPGEEDLDFGELRRILSSGQDIMPPDDVFIILFDKETDNEGVYTVEYPLGSSNNFLLAFENESDANEFAQTLKIMQFSDISVSPTPQSVDFKALENAAQALGAEIQFIPNGTSLSPPIKKENLDHNPQLKYSKSELDNLIKLDSDASDDGIVNWEFDSNSWE